MLYRFHCCSTGSCTIFTGDPAIVSEFPTIDAETPYALSRPHPSFGLLGRLTGQLGLLVGYRLAGLPLGLEVPVDILAAGLGSEGVLDRRVDVYGGQSKWRTSVRDMTRYDSLASTGLGLTLAVSDLLPTGLLGRSTPALLTARALLGGDLGIGAPTLLAVLSLGRVRGRSRGLGPRVGGSLGRVVPVSCGGESSVGDADVSDVRRSRSDDAGGLSRGRGDGSEELGHVAIDGLWYVEAGSVTNDMTPG